MSEVNKDVYKEISDFEKSPEVRFAILNKIDRIWDHEKGTFCDLINKIYTHTDITANTTNTDLTKTLDKYIEDNKIK